MSLQMKYFVLKPAGDDIYAEASREAMCKYADVVCDEDPELADDLFDWANDERENAKKEEVEVELSHDQLHTLLNMAHEQDITFNELCNNIIREQIEKLENDEDYKNEFLKDLKREDEE